MFIRLKSVTEAGMPTVATMADISKVARASAKTPTLRVSIPLDLAKELGIDDGDFLSWKVVSSEGKRGLFCRKVE